MASSGNISYQGSWVFDGKGYAVNSSARAQEFEFKTDAIIGAIGRNPVGRILIREINGSPLGVAIRPLAPSLSARLTQTNFVSDIGKLSPVSWDAIINDSNNGDARVASVPFTLQEGTVVATNVPLKPLPPAVPAFVPVLDRQPPLQFFIVGNNVVVVDPISRKIVSILSGSGASTAPHGPGSYINIWYNPDTFETYTAKSDVERITAVTIAGRAARLFSDHFHADDVLCHELVHALRGLRGLITPAGGFGPFQNKEDFYAIMLTNIYLSADGRNVDMRGSHAVRWEPLKPDYAADAKNFYFDASSAIADLFLEMPTLCQSIVALPGVWNPLHVHAQLRAFAP
jgi:hypothetical protein